MGGRRKGAGHSVDSLTRHPYDDGVWLGGIGALWPLPEHVDAVIDNVALIGTVLAGWW